MIFERKKPELRNRITGNILEVIRYSLNCLRSKINLSKAGNKNGLPNTPNWFSMNTFSRPLRSLRISIKQLLCVDLSGGESCNTVISVDLISPKHLGNYQINQIQRS